MHTGKNLANANQNNLSKSKSNSTVSCVFNKNMLAHHTTILVTVVVKVTKKKENISLRIIIDSRSNRNFVKLTWCKQAYLQIFLVSTKVFGMANLSHKVIGLVNFTLKFLINS